MVVRGNRRLKSSNVSGACARYTFKSIVCDFSAACSSWLTDPAYCSRMRCLLLVIECVICVLIIENVPYTEIDWRTYMQQVECFINGTLDYGQIRGDTGPLVYPAGHVYMYRGLHWLTDGGQQVRRAQYVFAGVYLMTVWLVGGLYARAGHMPPYLLTLMTFTSYRVHSVYLLRLFNDPLAMLLLYAAVTCALDSRWSRSSLLLSLAVSVKMNVLLFSPAWLVLLVRRLSFKTALLQLVICATVQVALAAPFLCVAPLNYVAGAFDLSRVFEHKWTVNWRMLDEHVFVDRRLHVALLLVHVALVAAFTWRHWWSLLASTCRDSRHVLVPLFTCNLVGVAMSRSLHYQFYVWCYHSLPLLLWSAPQLAVNARLLILGCLELCWNTYPSTPLSSLVLHCCHGVLLVCLWRAAGSMVGSSSSSCTAASNMPRAHKQQ